MKSDVDSVAGDVAQLLPGSDGRAWLLHVGFRRQGARVYSRFARRRQMGASQRPAAIRDVGEGLL